MPAGSSRNCRSLRFLRFAEFFHISERVSAADNSTHSNEDYVDEFVVAAVLLARVNQIREAFDNGQSSSIRVHSAIVLSRVKTD